MKKVKADNVWPRDVIETSAGIGRVIRVQSLWHNKSVAEILFSWHQDELKSITVPWSDDISVLADEDLADLFE